MRNELNEYKSIIDHSTWCKASTDITTILFKAGLRLTAYANISNGGQLKLIGTMAEHMRALQLIGGLVIDSNNPDIQVSYIKTHDGLGKIPFATINYDISCLSRTSSSQHAQKFDALFTKEGV